MRAHADEVARYYDENTRRFLARGEGRGEGVLHRAVWGEGVRSRTEALHFVHELILRELESYPGPRILDLGCGIGASLSYLLERRPGVGFGITVSEAQFAIATGREGAVWLKGDFCEDPLPPAIDLAYGIESFVHARDPDTFFRNVSAALGFGARLVLADDFLSNGSRDEKLVRRFVEGWHARSLRHPREVDEIAAREGLVLVSDRDLTPMIELDRPRDWAVGLSVALLRPLGARTSRLQSLFGGSALRQGLKRGLLSYRFRVWEKREVS